MDIIMKRPNLLFSIGLACVVCAKCSQEPKQFVPARVEHPRAEAATDSSVVNGFTGGDIAKSLGND